MEETNDFLQLPLDYGLFVKYDGRKNVIIGGDCPTYQIGEMMCELARVAPSEIKDVLTTYENFDDELTQESLGDAFIWLEKALIDKFGLVAGKILCSEFMGYGAHVFNQDVNDEWVQIVENSKNDDASGINKFIFEGTEFTEGGDSCVGQTLLTVYTTIAMTYVTFKYLFTNTMEACTGHEEGDEVDVKIMDLFGILVGSQHIDFMVMALDGELASVYNIKNAISLLAFEFANSFNNGVLFNKCKNCGNYFVLTGRVDTVYCSYPAPNKEGKTCKEVGAQITRANKEKNDVTTSEYRKVYMKLKMQATRHPKDSELQDKIEALVDEAKDWRRRLADGENTTEEYMEWLEKYR